MTDKAKRILWLLNHTTLRAYELPLLRSLGYEIYTPKIFPDTAANRSASVDWSWDEHLTIPRDDLAALNRFDFYEDRYSSRIRELINEHFETAICAYIFPMLDNLITYFDGRLVLRAFGLTSINRNYYDSAKLVCDPGFTRRFAGVLDRFWFGQAYPHLDTIEPTIVQQRSAYLPLGLPARIRQLENQWTGGIRQILFVCPEIKTFEETAAIYKEFKKNFGSLPHVICGNQSIAVSDDKSVVGRLEQAAYEDVFRGSSAMFYHSRLPRHLHYHPLEAMCIGMPVVFMKQGMLGELGGRDLPGACATSAEARYKIKRILDGDTELVRAMRSSQQQLLQVFDDSSILDVWRKTFVQGIMATEVRARVRAKKVALLSTRRLSIEQMSDICALTESLQAISGSGNTKFVVGFLDLAETEMQKLRSRFPTVNIRGFGWTSLSARAVRRAQELQGTKFIVEMTDYVLPDDGVSQFMDCDFWVIFSDSIHKPVAPIKPSALVSRDLSRLETSMNEVPLEEEVSFATMARSAEAVFSESTATLRTLERQCGVQSGFTKEVSKVESRSIRRGKPGSNLIWLTEPKVLKSRTAFVSTLKSLIGAEKPFAGVTIVSRTQRFGLDIETSRPTKDSPSTVLRFYEQIKRLGLADTLRIEDGVDIDAWRTILEDARCVFWPDWTMDGLEFLQSAAAEGVPIVSHSSGYIDELATAEQLSPAAIGSQKQIVESFRRAVDLAGHESVAQHREIDPVLFHKELEVLL